MRTKNWNEFKSYMEKGLSPHERVSADNEDQVELHIHDGAFHIYFRAYTGETYGDPSAEWLEYMANYQSNANKRIQPALDPDNFGVRSSPRYAPDGWYQKIHEFEFTTAKLQSLEDEKQDFTEYGYGSLKFYDAAGTELTTQNDLDTSCVKTVLDWTTPHDLMVLSGYAKQIIKPNTRVKIWGVVSPHVPVAQGGNLVFVDGTNLEFEEPGNGIGIQGVAGTTIQHEELVPGSGLYSNTIRLQVWTPDSAGLQHRIQIKLDLFIPPGN